MGNFPVNGAGLALIGQTCPPVCLACYPLGYFVIRNGAITVKRSNANDLALGYAWGTEDGTGIKTASAIEGHGPFAFAEAFANAWEDYNQERRGMMTSVTSAYRTWQDTNGATIDQVCPPTV